MRGARACAVARLRRCASAPQTHTHASTGCSCHGPRMAQVKKNSDDFFTLLRGGGVVVSSLQRPGGAWVHSARSTPPGAMPIAPNIAGHKNSFSTQVRCGNWQEDCAGARHASALPARHASAAFESTKYSRDYLPPGVGGPKVAFAPAPIDQLDGHLVMAHGTDIISRGASADMYLSLCVGVRAWRWLLREVPCRPCPASQSSSPPPALSPAQRQRRQPRHQAPGAAQRARCAQGGDAHGPHSPKGGHARRGL